MFPNYLKIGWRSLRREGGFALLNALGLAIGIAAVVLELLRIHHESTIPADRHHPQFRIDDGAAAIMAERADEYAEINTYELQPLNRIRLYSKADYGLWSCE